MDEMTQQNAALVEEAAAAAGSMQEQAANLASVVGAFRLDDAGRPAAPVPAPAPALNRPLARTAPRASTTAPLPAVRRSAPVTQGDDWEAF
jgi:methyl-accepting chemotaxis protein